jgi:hypothetical protein
MERWQQIQSVFQKAHVYSKYRGHFVCAYRKFGRVHNRTVNGSRQVLTPSATVNLTEDENCPQARVVPSHGKARRAIPTCRRSGA